MARKEKKRSGWKGGSFLAAVGGYVNRKTKKAARRLGSRLKKETLGIKPKRRK